MYNFYVASNKDANLVKVGITKTDRGGNARIKDYTNAHDLPKEGWKTVNYASSVTDRSDALRIERDIRNSLVSRGDQHLTESNAKEVFVCRPVDAAFATQGHLKKAGVFVKR